ncbi:glycosyltransferase family 2 protein [Neptunitalea lumnitzerae]|uniref:Glycosyl transferase n=1 Tax=Neptunitalea lumnitzerae TaxID=2965509 RepID=A0ABQ5MFF7_9FLAO|nr:glycosyltransferase family 2 protein [Neptunitalea sp. Y10]GLB48129.1 glycosyl transferase [Neptunitalea sp. Y10]
MAKPLVSIITPTYNSEQFIEATIASVQKQTYPYWEMLIVDDASTDTTTAIISNYKRQDARIKFVALPTNKGAGYARNKAINMAKGHYIAFLDADDIWLPEKLKVQVKFMESHKDALVSFSSYQLMDEQGELMGVTIEALPEVSLGKMLKSNYVGNLTGMYNAKELGKIYMPLIRKRQDWGLWLSCIKKSGKAYGIPEVLAYYRIRKNSISSNKFNLLKHNYIFYRKALNFGILKSGTYLSRFLIEHFFVKSKQTKKHS